MKHPTVNTTIALENNFKGREVWEKGGIKDAHFGKCAWQKRVELNWRGQLTL